jgi:hypothetical protein
MSYSICSKCKLQSETDPCVVCAAVKIPAGPLYVYRLAKDWGSDPAAIAFIQRVWKTYFENRNEVPPALLIIPHDVELIAPGAFTVKDVDGTFYSAPTVDELLKLKEAWRS